MRSRFRTRRAHLLRLPSILEPTWQGAPLAFEQLEDLLHQIRHSLQPPRADIIDRAARTALHVVDLLEDAWEAMPPGSVPFLRATERRALSGLPGAVAPQTREEEEEEEEEREERHPRRRERDEDDDDRDRDDDDDDRRRDRDDDDRDRDRDEDDDRGRRRERDHDD